MFRVSTLVHDCFVVLLVSDGLRVSASAQQPAVDDSKSSIVLTITRGNASYIVHEHFAGVALPVLVVGTTHTLGGELALTLNSHEAQVDHVAFSVGLINLTGLVLRCVATFVWPQTGGTICTTTRDTRPPFGRRCASS